MSACNWPFHHDKWCEQCKAFDAMHAQNLERYMQELADRRKRRKEAS